MNVSDLIIDSCGPGELKIVSFPPFLLLSLLPPFPFLFLSSPLLWVLVCYAVTQLATPFHQRHIQMVRSKKVAWKRLTELNGTPAMDLGQVDVVLI